MNTDQHVPAALLTRDNWAGRKPSGPDDHWGKRPMNPRTGRAGKSNDSGSWSDFRTAVAASERYGWNGVGFMLSEPDGITGVDLDHCRNPETGAIEPWAREIVDLLHTYWEVSPSGTGLRAWVFGKLNATRNKWPIGEGKAELFYKERFLTFTGDQLAGAALEVGECQAELDELVMRLDQRVADEAVLKQLKPREKCKRILEGDFSDYGDDQSIVDLVVVGGIAREVGADPVAIDRIFRLTILMRPKWDKKHSGDGRTYGEMTIDKAIADLGKSSSGKPSQKELLLARAEELDFLHTPDGEGFAVVPFEDHDRLLRISSKAFEQWLRQQFWMSENKAPTASSLRDALATLEARANFEGEARNIGVRITGSDEIVHLDLVDDLWRAVEITPGGYAVIPGPLSFRRTKAMRALPEPEAGGSLADLRPFLNLDGEDAFIIVVSWLVAALRPSGPYPILVLTGEQGSAKSVNSRILRALIDPSSAALKSTPTSDRDLMIAAKASWVLAYDNLSGISTAMSDALCRLATGGGFSTRQLYTDDEEVIFDAARPMIVNGIDDLTGRADLVSRSLGVTLPPIAKGKRRTERDLMREFEAARPRILGALCAAVATALKRLPEVVLDDPPRMSDFATWVVAAEPALPWKEGRFLEAYEANRKALDDLALDLDRVAAVILELMAHTHQWSGTATDLLGIVQGEGGQERRGQDIPKTPRGISNRLERIAPLLRTRGIEVERRKGTERLIIITNHSVSKEFVADGGASYRIRKPMIDPSN